MLGQDIGRLIPDDALVAGDPLQADFNVGGDFSEFLDFPPEEKGGDLRWVGVGSKMRLRAEEQSE